MGQNNSFIRLKKGEDRRIKRGHLWVYSNEIDVSAGNFKTLKPGQEVTVLAHDEAPLGRAYVNPHSLIAARIFSKDPNAQLDSDLFSKGIDHALKLRSQLFAAPYYRLVFGEGDFLPGLIIDRYGDDFVCQLNTAGMDAKEAEITSALTDLFPSINSILLRNDNRARLQEALPQDIKPAFGKPSDEVLLEENGIRYYAPFLSGQKTAWFYDHRLNRARLQNYVSDKKVLDVFSYLGAFAVASAVFGAAQVTAIDASTHACDYIRKNAQLNQVSDKIAIMNADAFDAMKQLSQQNQTFDVIILDPPAFVKKMKDKREGEIAYLRLNEMAMRMLAPNGILISCSCSMHTSEDDLMQIVKRASNRSHTTLQLIERGHQGPDHPVHLEIPETNYLKALFFRKLG